MTSPAMHIIVATNETTKAIFDEFCRCRTEILKQQRPYVAFEKELSKAASCFIYHAKRTTVECRDDGTPLSWPFRDYKFKPKDGMLPYVQAAALYAIALEYLDQFSPNYKKVERLALASSFMQMHSEIVIAAILHPSVEGSA